MSGFVVFLGGETLPWLEVEHGRVIGRGEDFRESDAAVIAVAPASSVTYRSAAFGGLSPAQALAAARLDAGEVSLGTERHVAVAEAGDHYAMTDKAKMREWLSRLAEHDIIPSAIIPAPSLLPVPETGFVRGILHGETVLRSAQTALEDDGAVSLLVVGDSAVRTLDALELERAIAAAIAAPALDLLQGDFAPRTDWSASAGYWRRMAIFAGIAAVLTLAVPLAQWTRLSMATSSLDAQGAAIAAKALGEVSASEDAIDRLQDQLADQRGGGAGFLPTLGVVTAAMESMPNVELSALSFDPDGTLRATLRAGRQAEIEIVRRAIETRGFSVTQGMPGNGQGRAEIELQVRPG